MSKKRRKKKRKSLHVPPPVKSVTKETKIIEDKKPLKKISHKSLIYVLTILLLLIAFGFLFYFLIPRSSVKRDTHLNVLLITLDTTRADRLGCYGYEKAKTPNLDFLALNGVKFLNAYCQVPLTFPSHCSILTGMYPLYHGVRNNGSYYLRPDITTLAEIVKSQGLKTAAFVSSFTVDSRFGLDQGFDSYDDNFAAEQAFKALNSEREAEKVFASFASWLDKNHEQQFFLWVHFFDPHLPYVPPPPFREEFQESPYDGEIAYMDFYVGKTVKKLREKKLLDKTFIVLAGDHGEAFGEKGEDGHGVFLYEGTMKVPLIFYAENHLPQKKVVKAKVRLIDIMPSILDMLRIPMEKEIQGESLLPYIQGKKKINLPSYMETYFPRENYGWSELVGLVDGDWKYIHAPREELYNLKVDPGETKNVIVEEKKVLTEKKERLKALIAKNTSPVKAEKREMTAEERERLRSLGYVEFSGEPSKGSLPDPKDRIEELKMMTQAEIYEFKENYQEAAKIYEKVLSLRPEAPTSYVNLALMYARMERFDEAISVLEEGNKKISNSSVLLSRLGHTYMLMGRLKKALDVWQALLRIDPNYFDALLASAWILDFIGNKEEARSSFEKALTIEPENKFLRKNYAMNLATTGKIQEAIKIYEQLAEDYPDDYEIRQDLGIAYGYLGDLSKAIDTLKKALSLRPTPTAYYNLAVAMKKVGNINEAVHYLRLYLENPDGESEQKIKNAQIELQSLEKMLKR
ncbi:MAG: sulfatase-like hydrolase/transferase [Acidobacteriota bacterium]